MLKKKKPIIVKESVTPSVTPEPEVEKPVIIEKPVVISDECRCLAKPKNSTFLAERWENKALCENRDRDVDDCLNQEGKCFWGPERQECQDQVPQKPIVEEKPEPVIPEPVIQEPVIEEETVVKPAAKNSIDDLIKSGVVKTQTFQNCNILGWTPTVNAMFVRLCPFGMQMGGKMKL